MSKPKVETKTKEGEERILPLCLKCKDTIPLFTLSQIGNMIWIEIKCNKCHTTNTIPLDHYLNTIKIKSKPHTCTIKPSHSSLSASKYCVDCSKWICDDCYCDHFSFPSLNYHLILTRELMDDIFCSQHMKRILKYYCNDCNCLLCDKCKEGSHLNHSLIDFESWILELQKINCDETLSSFDIIQRNNKHMKEYLISELTLEIEYLNKIKEDIEESYRRNEEQNKTIREFFILTYDIFKMLEDRPQYNLFKNIQNNFHVNNNKMTIKEGRNMMTFNLLNCIEYFNKNYIVNVQCNTKCISTLNKSHESGVNCLIQIKDGRLVSCSDDKTIKLWKQTEWEYECESILEGHKSKVYALHQLIDNRLVSGSFREIKIWDLTNNECLSTLTGHTNSVFALINSKDNLLISAGDNTLKLWDVSSYNCLSTLSGHNDIIYCLIELRDNRIASGSNDKSIKLWNVEERKCVGTLNGHIHNVNVLFQLNDGRLVSGSCDLTIRFWDINSLKQVGIIDSSDEIVLSFIQLSNGVLISTDENICLWDINECKLIKDISHQSYIHKLVQLNDGRIASCSDDNSIQLWNI